ncbi:MAG: DUF1552 domain-containing protein [Proteobacteria bacterium]|nr:DUF1552 domain-containing protein [Pseudomonadota bacterium]
MKDADMGVDLFETSKDNENGLSVVDRRTLLKGLGGGAVLFNPLLSQIVSAAPPTSAPKRVLFIYVQQGIGTLPVNGALSQANIRPYLAPFMALKDQFMLLQNVRQTTSWGNAHDVSYSNLLTQAVMPNDNSSDFNSHFPRPFGPSLDYVLGKAWNTNVMRLSAGYSSWGMPNPLCFDNNRNLLSPVVIPSVNLALLTGFLPSTGNSNQGVMYSRRSLLDLLKGDIAKFKSNLPSSTHPMLEAHLAAVNEAYASFGFDQSNLQPVGASCQNSPTVFNNVSSPAGRNLVEFLEQIKLGFLCGSHRVAVLGVSPDAIANETDTWDWVDKDGVPRRGYDPAVFGTQGYHHAVAHYCNANENAHLCYEGGLKHVFQRIADFCMKLSEITDLDGGSVLDNTIVVLHGEVGNGEHEQRNVNHIILGGKNLLKTGRFIDVGTSAAVPRLVNYDYFGQSGVVTQCGYIAPGTLCPSRGAKTEADVLAGLMRALGMKVDGFGLAYRNTSPLDFSV